MEISKERKNEIFGIFISVFGILLGISLYSNSVGIVGKILKIFFTVLSGKGAYLFPFIILVLGISLIRSRVLRATPRLVGLIMVICSTLVFLHLILIPFGVEFPAALEGNGGGLFGSIFAFLLRKFLGQTGAYITMTAVILIGFLLLFDILLVALFTTIKQKCRLIWQKTADLFISVKDKMKEVFKFKRFKKKKEEMDDQLEFDFEDKNDQFLKELANLEPEVFDQEESNVQSIDVETDQLDEIDKKSEPKPKKDTGSVKSHSLSRPKSNREYKLPILKLLTSSPMSKKKSETTDQSLLLQETLQSFGVKAKVQNVSHGPTITRYELQPAPGVKVSRIVNLADDIALAMAATDVRIVAPIPGKAVVGVEVPNAGSTMVKLKDILDSDQFKNAKSKLSLALGVGIAGEPIIADLVSMPHLLVAGATGSGKSVGINTFILSILYKAKPDEVKFLLVDPKKVEMTAYKNLPHLLAPVVTDSKKASAVLKMVVQEMENRYDLFASSGTRGLESYNQLMKKRQEAFTKALENGVEVEGSLNDHQPLPYIVIIIDELADLMMVAANDVEDAICRLAQMARAAGIHLIIATQRPSVDVITGLIKANIPSRVAFAVSSQVDSRTILDTAGAEKLLGKGDMLFAPVGANKPRRVQGAFVSTEEIHKVMDFVKKQEKPEYAEAIQQLESGELVIQTAEERDELYEEAVKIVISSSASISMLQRRLHIGYARAARLIDVMEQDGIVGPYAGSKAREVLVSENESDMILNKK